MSSRDSSSPMPTACWLVGLTILLTAGGIWCLPSSRGVAWLALAIAVAVQGTMPFWWKRAGWFVLLGLLGLQVLLLAGVADSCQWDIYLISAHKTARRLFGLTGLLVLCLPIWGWFHRYSWGGLLTLLLGGSASLIAYRSVLDYWRQMSPQPPMLYQVGDSRADADRVYTMAPYSRIRHYYPTDPRAYFEHQAQALSPWQAWQFRGSFRRPAPEIPRYSADRPHWVRIEFDAIAPETPTLDFCLGHWRGVRTGENFLSFQARADEPRPLSISIVTSPEFKLVQRRTFNLHSQWQPIEVRFPSMPGQELLTSIEFFPSRVPVELDAPMVSFEAGAAPQDGRLKPYWTEYQINDAGFRGQDISKTKPSGTQRVLCLGDSFTFGQGVKAGDTYAEQLQKILCSPTAPGRKVEVINAGRCGYSTREELVVLQKEGLAFDPDLVILQLSDNDVQDHLRNHRSPQVNEAVHTYAEIVDTVIELIRAAESHDTRVLVFLFRINAMYRGWYTLQEELKRIPSHVPVVDLGREVEPTLGLFAENYWLYCVHPIDQHPNERAHYWAARVLASAIDREQLLQRASE